MKKLIYTLFILFLAIVLVACKGDPTVPVETTPTVEPTPTPTPTPTPEEDTLDPLLFGVADAVVDVGGEFDPLEGITATDNVDGNLTSAIVVTGDYDLNVAGVYTLTYTVTDAAGNVATEERTLVVRVAPTSELFVTNGDFSEPLDGTWTHWAGEGGASTVQIVDGVLEYDITANGSQFWSSQFSQPNLEVPQGKGYRFQFDAKADEPRAIVTKLENAQYVGYFDEAHMLTTEWATYEIEFFITSETITNGKLIFGGGTTAAYLTGGDALTTVYLDNIEFIELEASEDDQAPVISGATDRIIDQNETFVPLQGITVSDNMDTELTVDDIVITGTVDSATPGDYVLTYTLSDASGNEVSVERTITVADGLAPSTWLVANGDFEEDQLAPEPQPAETGWGWHGAASFTAQVKDGMAILDIATLGTVVHGVQFYQQNRVIEQGRIYKVTFDAKADIARPIMVALEQGFTRRFDQIVDLTTDWVTYEVIIDHILPGYTNGKFAFFMGLVGSTSVPTTVYLDNVSVERIAEIVDTEAPVLRGVEDYIIRKGIDFDPLAGVTLFDAVDKDVTVDDIVVNSNLDANIVGEYAITYTVADASLNEAVYTRAIHVVEAVDMPENDFTVVNGDFEIDQNTPYAQPAVDGWGWHGNGTFTVDIANGIMTQVISNVGTVFYGTQFYQQNRMIDTRATYLLSFDAKVDDARSIQISLEAGATAINWTEIIDLTTDWVTYQTYITIPGGGFTNGKFAFFAGLVEANSPATTFYLDDVSLELVGYLVDVDAPMIFGADEVETVEGLDFDPLLGITVFDVVDKGLTPEDIVVTGTVDTNTPGDYALTYTLTDKSGNVTSLVRNVVVSASDGSIPTTFVLINNDFGTAQTDPAAAGEGWGWHGGGQFNVNIENGVAQIDVFETWNMFYGVQFYTLNRTVSEGHTYRFTFSAKADDPRPIQLNLESGGAKFSAFFDLDTEYAEYVYEYTHESASVTNGKFSFFIGNIHSFSTPTTVYFDYVNVERIMEKSADTVAPQIWGALDTVWLQGEAFDPMLGLRVYDHVDKTLEVADISYTGTVNVDVPGAYDLVYTLTDASGNVLTHTRVITVTAAVDMVDQRINFTDGDFEAQTEITTSDGNMGWTLKTGPGTGTWNPHQFVDGHLEIDILTVGTAPHGIQFFQRNGFKLEAHTTYTISFKAKADVARDIHVITENPNENWRKLALHTVELGTDWTTYELVIHNGFVTTTDAKIGFFLGLIDAEAPERSAATKVYFDDVVVNLVGYAVDNVAPMVWAADAEVEQNAVFNPLTGIKYGDFAKAPELVITSTTAGLVTLTEGVYTIDTSTIGEYVLTYTVTDIFGNVTVYDRALSVVAPVIE